MVDALLALPLVVEELVCVVAGVSMPSYPGGHRPSSVVTLAGGGHAGSGEHVGWTAAEHECFRDEAAGVPQRTGTLGAWLDLLPVAPGYARAALEAAAIDLALRQREVTLFALAGSAPLPVRYVVSFERRADPLPEARRIRAGAPGVELKIDVDPAWPDEVWTTLAALGGVAVVDFKESGTPAQHARAHRFLPEALLEDPLLARGLSATVEQRVSFDARIRRAGDVATLPVRPAAVNVKPARMGGVIEALRAVAACQTLRIPIYFGGMFEAGVGRRQVQALAALFAPDGPNDVAPVGIGPAPPPRPARLVIDAMAPGFAGPG